MMVENAHEALTLFFLSIAHRQRFHLGKIGSFGDIISIMSNIIVPHYIGKE